MNGVSLSHLTKYPSESKASSEDASCSSSSFDVIWEFAEATFILLSRTTPTAMSSPEKKCFNKLIKKFWPSPFQPEGLKLCNNLQPTNPAHFSAAFSSFTEADISLMKATGSVKSNLPLDIHAACSSSPAYLSLWPYTHLPFPHDQSSFGLNNPSAALLGDVLLPISTSHTIHFYSSSSWSVILSSTLHSPLLNSRRKWHFFM